MLKNLQIKFLKFKKTYLQGKVFSKEIGAAITADRKIHLVSLLFIFLLSTGGLFVRVYAEEEETSGDNNNKLVETINSNYAFTDASLNNTGTIIVEKIANPDSGELSAMGALSYATGAMYLEGPVSTSQYLAYLQDKANIGPSPTYAATNGYIILQPIMVLWTWARNLVYVFYVIIFIVIGIMIILRQKIGGQVPITIINSIPNVIFTLILVTFSYAISGFIIDLMHLITGIVHYAFFLGGNSIMAEPSVGAYSFQSPNMSVFQIFGTANITDFSAAFSIGSVSGVAGGWIINNIMSMITSIAGSNTLISVVLSIAGITAMFKIFFTLLTKYLTFMISPILAPFQFLVGSLPGRGNMIWNWFKGMLTSVGAFVGVYVAFCLMIIITGGTSGASAITGWSWFPPLTSFSASTSVIAHLVSYAIFIATPNIPAIIEKALQSQPSGLFGGVGQTTQQSMAKVPVLGDLAKILG